MNRGSAFAVNSECGVSIQLDSLKSQLRCRSSAMFRAALDVLVQLRLQCLDAVEPLNVPQSGQKVNLQRLAIQIARASRSGEPRPCALLAERGIRADVDCRRDVRCLHRRSRDQHKRPARATACRSRPCWPWETRVRCPRLAPCMTIPRNRYGRVSSRRASSTWPLSISRRTRELET